MQNHYLHYLTNVMSHQWSDPALTDYGEDHEYSFGGLAVEMLRLHTLFEQLGIKRGDKIATMGSSGRSTGTHLHYEVWKDGQAVNPRNYFK